MIGAACGFGILGQLKSAGMSDKSKPFKIYVEVLEEVKCGRWD